MKSLAQVPQTSKCQTWISAQSESRALLLLSTLLNFIILKGKTNRVKATVEQWSTHCVLQPLDTLEAENTLCPLC